MRRICYFLLIFIAFFQTTLFAQLSGTYTIGASGGGVITYPTGGYNNFATFGGANGAVTILNSLGNPTAAVTFNVQAGFTESLTSALSITVTGTVVNTITFQKSGAGANPVITAYTGVGSTDAIFTLSGVDYLTIDAIDLQENVANAANTAYMEFGYLLLNASATNGSQYNTIQNCNITLNRNCISSPTYFETGSVGIFSYSAFVTPSNSSGVNSYNKFYGNVIRNVFSGIIIRGYNNSLYYDQSNDIGGSFSGSGNSIQNYGGSAALTCYAIRLIYQNTCNISFNTINNLSGGGVAHLAIIYGVMHSTGTNSTVTITNNTITLSKGSNTSQCVAIYTGIDGTGTININYNIVQNCSVGGSSGDFIAIRTAAASIANLNITYNTIQSNTSLTTSGSVFGCWVDCPPTNLTFAFNTVNSLSKLSSGGSLYGLYINNSVISSGTQTINNNTFSNLSVTGASDLVAINSNSTTNGQNKNIFTNSITSLIGGSGSSVGTIGIQCLDGNTVNIYSNIINTITASGTLRGIRTVGSSSGPTSANIYANTINTLSSTAASSVVYGIDEGAVAASTTINTYGNKIYDISTSGNAMCSVYGISTGTATNHYISNNLIGDLRATASTSINVGVAGLYCSGGTNVYAYFNSINLNATSSGINFGTAGVYAATSLTTFTLIDNIIINTSTANGTGFTTAYRRSGASFANYQSGSNYNLFYAGTPGPQKLIFYNGTSYQTLASYQGIAGLSPRDANSISQNVSFISTTGSSTSFLHIDQTSCSAILSGIAITGYTVDYDNDPRTVPTIGADETGKATWTGVTNTDWETPANWANGLVPTIYYDAYIPTGVTNYPVITGTATCHSLMINASASLTMNSASKLTIDVTCSNATFTNAGTFTANSNSEVIFTGPNYTATIVPTTATQFENVTLNLGVGMGGSSTTVNGILQLKSGSYVFGGNAPTYSTNSTLQYNTNGSYTANAEWYDNTFSGAGWPQNVDIAGTGTKLVFNTFFPREMRGNLTIGSSDTLNLSGNLGGDLYIKGNWTRAATGGFNPVGRQVKFNGSTNQTITITGGGIETFHYVTINKSSGDLYLNNLGGNLTDMKITMYNYAATPYAYLTMTGGNINLNGQTMYWAAPVSMTAGQTASYWNTTGPVARYVTGAGTVSVTGTLYATSFEVTSASAGTLIFDQNVTLKDATGEINFGTGNLTTIKGIFQVDNGGAAVVNSAHYDVGSTLRFTNGNDYNIGLNDITWANGLIGDIGVPYHLEITTLGSSTDLIILPANTADHMIRGNLTITSSSLQLSTGATGDLHIKGNWTRTNGNFLPNSKTVIFSGTSLQTISLNAGYETYYGLTINNAAGISLSGATSSVNVTNLLTLTAGVVTTSTNEVYVANISTSAIAYQGSTSAATSWINGNLRRKIATSGFPVNYAFPLGSSTLTNGDGYQLAFLDFNSNANVDNIVGKFTANTASGSETYSLVVNGTTIVDRLDAGYWNFKPYDNLLSYLATPACSYNVTLNERGHLNSATSPNKYTVMKRVDAGGVWNLQCGIHNNATQTEPVIGETVHAERSGYLCTSFSDYAIGLGEFILPIELATFTVSLTNGNSLLEWNTSAEYNSDYFSIERSIDGVLFEEIGKTAAAGFSSMPREYSYTDAHANELGVSKIFYRLRMVDNDNSFEYSAVRWVDLNETDYSEGITIFPNPVNDEVSITLFSVADQSATLQVIDISGKVIREAAYSLSKGVNFIEIDHPGDLAAGLYFVHIASGRNFYTVKMVKE